MPTYNISVRVDYNFDVEADSFEEAEKMGWDYEEYNYTGEVYSIDVEEIESEEE